MEGPIGKIPVLGYQLVWARHLTLEFTANTATVVAQPSASHNILFAISAPMCMLAVAFFGLVAFGHVPGVKIGEPVAGLISAVVGCALIGLMLAWHVQRSSRSRFNAHPPTLSFSAPNQLKCVGNVEGQSGRTTFALLAHPVTVHARPYWSASAGAHAALLIACVVEGIPTDEPAHSPRDTAAVFLAVARSTTKKDRLAVEQLAGELNRWLTQTSKAEGPVCAHKIHRPVRHGIKAQAGGDPACTNERD